ncbi:MAG: MFS transporter [Gammaproteobacteria bacterium]|nr:MAG: MFS transporter [Gammaproteobacteria bacterium]RLA15169.1 MAG: MFS transporter [Gammaproteobacteria bacterium]
MSASSIKLLSFSGPSKILHLTWFAFFLTFLVWFNSAPLMISIRETFGLSDAEVKALLTLNVALTIPARIVVGMLVDKYGPKLIFSLLLASSSIVCFFFAFAQSYEALALSRFLLGFVGAGFVIGIRMISEWYPAKTVGVAEGIYGGWGNFGSAGAAMLVPLMAAWFGGDDGWRWSIAATGAMALIYSFIYYFSVSNTPAGSTYFKPKKSGAMEVTSKGDFVLYVAMNIPMFVALGVLSWKLGPQNLGLLSGTAVNIAYASLLAIFSYQLWHMWQINKSVFITPIPEIHRYKFKQVAILNIAYFATFGSEIAVISMLPLFFFDTFSSAGLSQSQAGMLAAGYAGMNLVARPIGGLLSDKFGRKTTMMTLLGGLIVGYLVLSQIDGSWWIPLVVVSTMFCAFFVHSGCGAVFAIVPLIKRRMTGQIAGMTGAYGNVGAVTFLTVLSFVSPQVFFMVIAGTGALVFILLAIFMDEPEGHMAEVMPDGTVQMIEVS